MCGSIDEGELKNYLKTAQYVPKVFVETGTYRGNTIMRVSHMFQSIHTIELSKKWYKYASKRLKGQSHVVCHQGDSAEVLSKLLQEIKEPVLIYLDAHYSGGETAFGKEEAPLLREGSLYLRKLLSTDARWPTITLIPAPW